MTSTPAPVTGRRQGTSDAGEPPAASDASEGGSPTAVHLLGCDHAELLELVRALQTDVANRPRLLPELSRLVGRHLHTEAELFRSLGGTVRVPDDGAVGDPGLVRLLREVGRLDAHSLELDALLHQLQTEVALHAGEIGLLLATAGQRARPATLPGAVAAPVGSATATAALTTDPTG